MKIRPVRAELFHADGAADMTQLTVVFAILRTRLKILFLILREHKALPIWEATRLYCSDN